MSLTKIYKGTVKLIAGTFLSRVLGFVREILAAKFVGGGHEMDVFALAYKIPNLVRGILGEKATESAFMPIYKTLSAKGQGEEAEKVSADTFKILLLILVLFLAIGYIAAPWIVTIMGKGFGGVALQDGSDKFAQATAMTRLLLPLVVMVGFFSFLGARLLSKEKFATYSAAPVIANVVIIAVILLTFSKVGWYCLAWAVLAGALAECVFFWLFTEDRFSILGRKALTIDLKNDNLRKAGKLWAPITFGSGIEKIGTIIETQMASFLGKGAVAALYYANLLNLLSFSVLGLSFNRSIIPHLTEQNAKENHNAFRMGILMGIRVNVLLLLPISIIAMFLAEPIVELFFQRGRFDSAATDRTTIAYICYSVGLVAMGGMGLFSRAFYALLDAKTPIKVSVVSLCLNVILNFMLWKTPLRHAGLALAAAISFWVNSIIQYILLNRRLKSFNEGIRLSELFNIVWRIFVPCIVMALFLYYFKPIGLTIMPGLGIATPIVRIGVTASAAIFTFLIVGFVCRIEEIKHVGRIFIPNIDEKKQNN